MHNKEIDYLIIGAGAMGIAFADEILRQNKITTVAIVEKRNKVGGHWIDAYPFVKLHQPAAFYGVNSVILGQGGKDLSSKEEILDYYHKVHQKLLSTGRCHFYLGYNYIGDNKIVSLKNPNDAQEFTVNKNVVDATYMNVEVPSTHTPKYTVDVGVSLKPLNELPQELTGWRKYCVIGSGKTGMDAILYLLSNDINPKSISWIIPNDAWLFNRAHIQVGTVGKEILRHVSKTIRASDPDDIFISMEKTSGIMRMNEETTPLKWRCATVSPSELKELKRVEHVVRKGRVMKISSNIIHLEHGEIPYTADTLFIDCSANGLARQQSVKIWEDRRITLQPILFCQQVFSAATIAKAEAMSISLAHKNQLKPVPHPELAKDWPKSLSQSVNNLLWVHRYFPLWMFRSRLNFMSHEPMIKYLYYALRAQFLSKRLEQASIRLSQG